MADAAAALIDLATAISDGAPVNWPAVEASEISEADAAVLQHLRVIAEIVSLQQRLASQPVHTSIVEELRQETPRAPDARETLPSWGPLRLIRLVGQGAFGEVYLAWDSRLDREVALKLLRRRESRRSAGSSLVDEGRLLAKVRHPNVITVYGAERIGDHVGVWMEFVDGPTLAQFVASGERCAPDEIARIGRDLCGALAAVHRAGLLHRDIKAQNVMRDADGRVVLMDFGAGREERIAGESSHGMAGTPLYLAPEIFEGAAASAQSDIYSLGVLLFHLATGTYPVDAPSFTGIRDRHRKRDQRSVTDVRPDFPRRLAAIIQRALACDPAARFEDADEMANAISALIDVRPRLRLWLAATALVIVAAAVAAVMGRVRARDAASQPPTTLRGAPAVTVRRLGQPSDVSSNGIPSPDGRYQSYVDSKGNLVLLELATGSKRSLTNFSGSGGYIDTLPSISRDDSRVVYDWNSEGGTELRVVNGDGSRSRTLAHDAPGFRWLGAEPFEWTPDGQSLLVAIHSKDGTQTTALLSAIDGSLRVLKTTRRFAYRMSLSPDGRYVAYDAAPDDKVDAHDIYVLATDGSFDVPLVEDPANDTSPIWSPDGRSVLFTTDRTGNTSVWKAPVENGRPSGAPEIVNRDMGQILPLGVTAQGQFFYLRQTGMVDVYTAELDPASRMVRGGSISVSQTFVGTNISPDWSRDGRYLAYVSQRGNGLIGPGSRVLVIRSVADATERTISPPLHFYIGPRWSPDGRTIYVHGTTPTEEFGVLQIDAVTGAIVSSRLGESFFLAALSRDGTTYIAAQDGRIVEHDLTSNRKTSVPLPASAGKPLYVALSPDEKWLAFSTNNGPDGRSLAVVPRQGGQPRVLVRVASPEFVQLEVWTQDGQSLLFGKGRAPNGQTGSVVDLWRVDVASGHSEAIGLSKVGLREVRLHPDGRRFAFTAGWPTREIWVMENFLPSPATNTH